MEGIDESHKDEGIQSHDDTYHAVWQSDMSSDEEA